MSNHKQDRRFKIAHREALIGLALAFIHFIWWYGFAYGFGSQPVEEYTYIFGFPAWFFYSCIVGFIVIVILLTILVYTVFKDVPLDEEGDDTE
ncbi:YhdT family protein [Priestia taiwanensis]|uniref:Sodium:pantothenate symporter n=1 Tax=Priestia taiwanensis TaxID=1347902 RepID=A0A917ASI8_9BACI|nr:YhdT family protein [Priestia taiwanensis]MBM7364072.1 putative membrane protein YhdT [Priestia taiwanensis]GGE71387.1 sodium:pantothenate symporter [Priestia taiwanensis]